MLNNLGNDPIPKRKKSCIVYKINCKDCKMSYTGQSSRALDKRIAEHMADCKYNRDRSALVMHMKNTGHKFNFDFNNIRILDEESSYFKRLVSEMIFISKFNSVNRIQDTQNLKAVFKNFISYIL